MKLFKFEYEQISPPNNQEDWEFQNQEWLTLPTHILSTNFNQALTKFKKLKRSLNHYQIKSLKEVESYINLIQ